MRSRFVQSANTCSGGAATCVVMVYRATVVTYSASDGGPMTPEDLTVRNATYRLFADMDRAPTHDEVAVATGQTSDAVDAAWHRLQADHALGARRRRPIFGWRTRSRRSRRARVEAAGRSWFANCGWDAFGIGAALHVDLTIHTECPTATSRSTSRSATIARPRSPSSTSFVPAARVVERHRLHLRHDARLPVGSTRHLAGSPAAPGGATIPIAKLAELANAWWCRPPRARLAALTPASRTRRSSTDSA